MEPPQRDVPLGSSPRFFARDLVIQAQTDSAQLDVQFEIFGPTMQQPKKHLSTTLLQIPGTKTTGKY